MVMGMDGWITSKVSMRYKDSMQHKFAHNRSWQVEWGVGKAMLAADLIKTYNFT